MAQILALEWDGSEARLVVAATRGERTVIEQAFTVALRTAESGEDQDAEEVDVGGQIAAAVSDRGIGRLDTLVAVGRASIELRQLSLPPAPDDELPELVQFQAMREFNEFDEDWLLDFVPLDEGQEEEARSVLAAAIGPELVRQLQETCEKAGLAPQRLILRPCAAASLLGRTEAAESTPPKLLVDLLADEADLTVMIDRKVVFLRTTRVSGDPLGDPDQRPALLAEIRRTIAAAENQLGGQRIEAVALCGSDEQHAAMAQWIEKQLGTPTNVFDPFAGLNLGRTLRGSLPEQPGRFAPLLGMVVAELEGTGHAIDFLHPRHRPEPPTRRMKWVFAGAAAVLLVASFFGYRGWDRYDLNRQIAKLEKESKELAPKVTQTEKDVAAVTAIEKWTATDVAWLDQLHKLSEDFRPAKEVMLLDLTLDSYTPGGRMTLDGLAAGADSITAMEEDLRKKAVQRKESRRVVETGSSEDDSEKSNYSRRFKLHVYVEPYVEPEEQ